MTTIHTPPHKFNCRSEAANSLANVIAAAVHRGECRYRVQAMRERLTILDSIAGEPTTLHAALHGGR